MSITLNKTLAVVAGIAMVASALFFFVPKAHANPLRPVTAASTADATTTVSYMTPGLATTTTAVFDSFASGANAYPDRAALLTQFTASSTASILGIRLEYSQDNIDWYADNLNELATTSWSNPIATPSSFTWTFASTTPGAGAVTNTNRSNKVIFIEVPTRYIRAVYTITGGNGGVWGSILPQRQSN